MWQSYFALLYVPIALWRPRLSWEWLLPLVAWPETTQPSVWKPLLLVVVASALLESRRRDGPTIGIQLTG